MRECRCAAHLRTFSKSGTSWCQTPKADSSALQSFPERAASCIAGSFIVRSRMFTRRSDMIEPMYVEAVREGAVPVRAGLVQGYMKIQCRQCMTAYHLSHDGAGLKLLRDYFLRASRQISGEHPNHSRVIILETQSVVAEQKTS